MWRSGALAAARRAHEFGRLAGAGGGVSKLQSIAKTTNPPEVHRPFHSHFLTPKTTFIQNPRFFSNESGDREKSDREKSVQKTEEAAKVLPEAKKNDSNPLLYPAIFAGAIGVLSSKNILIYNEEMIVAGCFAAFVIMVRRSFGQTFQDFFDERTQAIKDQFEQSLNPKEVGLVESLEQEEQLRTSLRICGSVVESLPMALSAPKCEKTVQAMLNRNLNVKLSALQNAISSRRIHVQNDLVTGFQSSVSEKFAPGSSSNSLVELMQEGLVVLKRLRLEGQGGGLKKEPKTG